MSCTWDGIAWWQCVILQNSCEGANSDLRGEIFMWTCGWGKDCREKMCPTSYCGELDFIQILFEDLFTEIKLLVWGMAMTSISSQSNYGKARKWFPGIHVNSQEICTKVGKGGGAIMKIFGKPQQTDRCLHSKILFNFPKYFCFDPHHQSHNMWSIHCKIK